MTPVSVLDLCADAFAMPKVWYDGSIMLIDLLATAS